jgi:hypothetical protein
VVEAFLELQLVRREAQEHGLAVSDAVLANAVAALSSGKHILLNAGDGKSRTVLARVLAQAAVSARRCIGYFESHMAANLDTDTLPNRELAASGRRLLSDMFEFQCWLILFDIDLWNFGSSGIAQAIADHKMIDIGHWRVIATSASLRRRPVNPAWSQIARQFAWVEVTVSTN